MMKSFDKLIEEALAEGSTAYLAVIRILGWTPKYVIVLSYDLTDDQFISWRPEVVYGRNGKLKNLPRTYFFEDADDAMLFYLTWRDQQVESDENDA